LDRDKKYGKTIAGREVLEGQLLFWDFDFFSLQNSIWFIGSNQTDDKKLSRVLRKYTQQRIRIHGVDEW
jgi:hypothetical protein